MLPLCLSTVSVALLGGVSNLTLLSQDKGDQSPACLDGTPYGYYYVPAVSAAGASKWTINIQGGGWCYNEQACYERSNTSLGSSAQFAKSSGCDCMNVDDVGLADDCHCVFLPYGDGASFAGYRADPWPVPGTNASLWFRGLKNLDAAVDAALGLGLQGATELVVTGGSAGGLSTFLHVDRIAARVHAVNPTIRVTAAPVVGYFLDHPNHNHTADNYTAWMAYIYRMQNLTFGSDGGLTPECQAVFATTPYYCFMAPHMQQFIKTPYFMLNSKYDWWQVLYILQLGEPFATPEERHAVLEYGVSFLREFAPVRRNPKHGAFITSCICHNCPFDKLSLHGKSTYAHYADWYHGRTSGADAIIVDPRLPNANGTIPYDPPAGCHPFPYANTVEWNISYR